MCYVSIFLTNKVRLHCPKHKNYSYTKMNEKVTTGLFFSIYSIIEDNTKEKTKMENYKKIREFMIGQIFLYELQYNILFLIFIIDIYQATEL